MVTGEKNSPLQAMQVVKGDQNVYPVPMRIAGPHRWFKYGGLVLSVGSWATGRQADNLSP